MSLAELVAREYGWILVQARKLCRDRMEAEDIAGDAVLKILCSGDCYDSGRPFRPWASVIILNTFKTKYRHDSLISFTDVEESVPAVSGLDTSDRAVMSGVWDAVRRCRRRSPSSVGCLLMYVSGYRYEEISRRYGIPGGTVRSRISYARGMIRKELGIKTLNKV